MQDLPLVSAQKKSSTWGKRVENHVNDDGQLQ